MLTIIKLFAPFTPFITEELYQKHFREYEKNKSVHLESWPEKIKIKNDKEDGLKWESLTNVLKFARQKKSEAKKSMKAEIILTIPEKDYDTLSDVLEDLKAVTSAKEIKKGNFDVAFL